jgi:hypothetical protein
LELPKNEKYYIKFPEDEKTKNVLNKLINKVKIFIQKNFIIQSYIYFMENL